MRKNIETQDARRWPCRFLQRTLASLAMLSIAFGINVSARAQAFVNWETPPVHPVAISPDNQTMAVANLPNGRVEIFSLDSGIPILTDTIEVGVDPVTVRFRTNTEIWVVNHISDTVSVVDITLGVVIATINTQDEPQDVVFAGTPQRAFISCSQTNTVIVVNPITHAQTDAVAINAERPRSMEVSADGSKVYVAIFESGNRSTTLGGGADDDGATVNFPPNGVSAAAGPHGGVNPPPNAGGLFDPPNANVPAPKVGIIVKQNAAGNWMDDNGGNWTNLVSGAQANLTGRTPGWHLIDHDVAVIDAATLAVTYADHLMNMVMSISVNPVNGNVYAIGTDGTNEIRFEPNVSGKFLKVEIAEVDPAGPTSLGIVDLNPHLDYLSSTIAQGERDKSLGDPRGIAWSSDGTRGYITGMGSNNMVVIDAAGSRVNAIPTELGEGPTGLALDEARGNIYVLNRFEATISVLNINSLTEITRVNFNFDPTLPAIKIGRKHLYDSHKNSGLGQIACASCHIDSKMDRLAWDLGDPSGALKSTSDQNNLGGVGALLQQNLDPNFHPMKGPMTTQTLQDIIGMEPFHWRGDRNGIEEFNPAFIGLQGDDNNLTPTEMQQFEDFLATIHFPPNPYRNFDNTLPTSMALPNNYATGRFALPVGADLPNGNAQAGLNKYRLNKLDADLFNCVTCHTLPTGAGANINVTLGNFTPISGGVRVDATFDELALGPNGNTHLFLTSRDGSTQDAIKVPELRNMYKKLGLRLNPKTESLAGFGFVHDGSVDSLSRFVSEPIFTPSSDQDVADLTAFLLCFAGGDLPAGKTEGSVDVTIPNFTVLAIDVEPLGPPSQDSHAAAGKQVTIVSPAAPPIIAQMIAEAEEDGTGQTRGLDLIVKGKKDGARRGWFYDRIANNFKSDIDGETITLANLESLADADNPLTFTVLPRGEGPRLGIDQDGDSFGDQTEILACTDPANPGSNPTTGAPNLVVVSGNPLNFGPQDIASGPSGTQTTTISNNGPGPLFFTGAKIVIAGIDAGDFHITNNPSTAQLATTASRSINVVFDPTTGGGKSAILLIITDDCDESAKAIPLSGVGTTGGITPTASPTETETPTPSPTPSDTVTPGPTETETATPTPSPVDTETPTPVETETETPTPTETETATPTGTETETPTPTPTETETETPTPTETETEVPTETPSPTESETPTPSPTDSPTPVPVNDAAFANSTIPAEIAANRVTTVDIAMANTGNTIWTAGGGYALGILNDTCSLTAGTTVTLAGITIPGTNGTFTLPLTAGAPATGCQLSVRMRQNSEDFGTTATFFIDIVSPIDDAAYVSTTLPAVLPPSQPVGIGITFRNTGNTQWSTAAGYSLLVLNDDCSVIGASPINLGPDDVVPGSLNLEYQFVTSITPPASGNCSVEVRIQGPDGVFGESGSLNFDVGAGPNAASNWTLYE